MKKLVLLPFIVVACSSKPTAEAPRTPASDESAGYWVSDAASKEVWQKIIDSKKGTMGVSSKSMVADALSLQSAEIGRAILRKGGNAFDAFVAMTLANYVQAPGTTSLAGPLNMVGYQKRAKKFVSVNAGMKKPSSPESSWARNPSVGNSTLIPGAPRGLFEIQKKLGRMKWREVVAPAIELAEKGFVVPKSWALVAASRKTLLSGNEYAKKTYFDGEEILKQGATLKLPAYAETLKAFATEGDRHFYAGEWTKAFVAEVNARGGKVTLQDLKTYSSEWTEPLRFQYRGHDLYVPSGRVYGGGKFATAMKILERFDLKKMGHWSSSLETAELLARTIRVTSAEKWYRNPSVTAKSDAVETQLDPAKLDALVTSLAKVTAGPGDAGSHSYHVVVVDEEGNVATGTNTIESMPYGDYAIFVNGLPLTSAGKYHPGSPQGELQPEPTNAVIAFRDGKFQFAAGAFSSALFPADVQVASNIIDFGMNAEDAILTPRIGYFFMDLSKSPPAIDESRLVIDKRYPEAFVNALMAKGLPLSQIGWTDTGMPMVIRYNSDAKRFEGMTPEALEGAALGD